MMNASATLKRLRAAKVAEEHAAHKKEGQLLRELKELRAKTGNLTAAVQRGTRNITQLKKNNTAKEAVLQKERAKEARLQMFLQSRQSDLEAANNATEAAVKATAVEAKKREAVEKALAAEKSKASEDE